MSRGFVEVAGGRFGDYVVVIDEAAIARAEAIGTPTWWPSEIRELDRLRAEAPGLVDVAVRAKLALGAGARVVTPTAQDPDAVPRCECADDPVIGFWLGAHPELECLRCWLERGKL